MAHHRGRQEEDSRAWGSTVPSTGEELQPEITGMALSLPIVALRQPTGRRAALDVLLACVLPVRKRDFRLCPAGAPAVTLMVVRGWCDIPPSFTGEESDEAEYTHRGTR